MEGKLYRIDNLIAFLVLKVLWQTPSIEEVISGFDEKYTLIKNGKDFSLANARMDQLVFFKDASFQNSTLQARF